MVEKLSSANPLPPGNGIEWQANSIITEIDNNCQYTLISKPLNALYIKNNTLYSIIYSSNDSNKNPIVIPFDAKNFCILRWNINVGRIIFKYNRLGLFTIFNFVKMLMIRT